MRSSVAPRSNGALIADNAIAFALVGSAAFFIIDMGYRVGHIEPTRAELILLRTAVHVAHSAIPAQRLTRNETGNAGEPTWPIAPSEQQIH
jgi:hypothetical protein